MSEEKDVPEDGSETPSQVSDTEDEPEVENVDQEELESSPHEVVSEEAEADSEPTSDGSEIAETSSAGDGDAAEEPAPEPAPQEEAVSADATADAEGLEAQENGSDLFLSPDDSEGEVVEICEPEPEFDARSARIQELEEQLIAEETLRQQTQEELQQAQEQLKELSDDRDETKNRLLRTAADLDNFRRRTHREKEEMRKYGIDKAVYDLIPAVDNLERALQHADNSGDSSSVVDGVRMVYRQIVSALEKHGVMGFDSRGEQFDPQRHEAIQQVETSDHATGEVIEQYQKGYFLHDRLLRPALVSVAKYVEPAQDVPTSDAELESEPAADDEAAIVQTDGGQIADELAADELAANDVANNGLDDDDVAQEQEPGEDSSGVDRSAHEESSEGDDPVRP